MPSRRSFLRSLGVAATGALVSPEALLADPYRLGGPLPGRGSVLRVRGRVGSLGRGIAGVAVSDGYDVVTTDGDGRFELVTRDDLGFVHLCVPPGYRIPTGPRGTARFYRPLRADASGEMAADFDLEPFVGSDDRHALLVLPDIQTENDFEMDRFRRETVPDLRETIGALGDVPAAAVSCGDIMFDDLSLYPAYEEGVAGVGIPFFQCVGNHDLDFDGFSDEASTATFSSRYGPRYYAFDRGEVHYVVLDDVLWHGAGYIGYLGHDQLHWLTADLALREPGSTVVVAAHIPVQGSRFLRDGERSPGESVSITNREILYRLLEPFDAHVIAGHTHENDHLWTHGVHEHVSGTVCGAWWSGEICADGTPNGYSVYEVEGSRVRWRYKATGAPEDHQMRLYSRGSDPRAPEEIVANIWDADEDWTVTWYEDGDRRGPMARRLGFDPRSRAEHVGPDLPARRSWVEPYPTFHLYWAPVSQGHGRISIEAVDRFGRTYTAGL